jgi:hypothetical protein
VNSSHHKIQGLCEMASGPVGDDAIRQAERELGVVFPREYRELLSEFGSIIGKGFEVYGLPASTDDEPPVWRHVVRVNKQLRLLRQGGTERSGFVAISDNGMGVYFFLDTSSSPETSIWAVGPGIDRMVSQELADFLANFAKYSAQA